MDFRLPSRKLSAPLADSLVVASVLITSMMDPVWQRSEPSGALWAAAAGLSAAVLLLRRRHPLATTVMILALWVTVHSERAADDPPFQFLVLLVCAYALGAYAPLRRGVAGVALLAIVFAALNLTRGEVIDAGFAGAVQFSVLFVFGRVISGASTRERELEEQARRLETERDTRAAAAVGEERARIARDLHDALGHAVSVMVMQAGVVRTRLAPDQREERELLLSVERVGRDCVGEMRRMLGMLRHDDAVPEGPVSLGAVHDVVAAVCGAGADVELSVEGERGGVPAGVDVAGLRIVQEALTNVLRHAPGASVRVGVAYEPEALCVEVLDDGPGGQPANGDGHGLIGMRERVALYGGTLEAGPQRDGGFGVRARLPFGREQA